MAHQCVGYAGAHVRGDHRAERLAARQAHGLAFIFAIAIIDHLHGIRAHLAGRRMLDDVSDQRGLPRTKG